MFTDDKIDKENDEQHFFVKNSVFLVSILG